MSYLDKFVQLKYTRDGAVHSYFIDREAIIAIGPANKGANTFVALRDGARVFSDGTPEEVMRSIATQSTLGSVDLDVGDAPTVCDCDTCKDAQPILISGYSILESNLPDSLVLIVVEAKETSTLGFSNPVFKVYEKHKVDVASIAVNDDGTFSIITGKDGKSFIIKDDLTDAFN